MQFLLISDFTINPLGNFLKKEITTSEISTKIAPFNQVQQTLIELDSEIWQSPIDVAVIWTLPENFLKNFNSFLDGDDFDYNSLLNEVDNFCQLIIQARKNANYFMVFSWTLDQTLHYRSREFDNEFLTANELIDRLNTVLKDNLSRYSNILLIDSKKQISQVGAIAYNSKLWYLSKTPFHSSVYNYAAKEIAFQLNGLKGLSKKLIVVDLDNTLWGGILGDDGVDQIILGGHHPLGEAFQDFQRALKAMKNNGIILAISSKNDEQNALNAIENHPEMILKKSDFVKWKINWDDKAKNIQELATELNLGLDSIVFLDDNVFERNRVKEVFPEIYVPELPSDPMLYKQFLLQLNCFNLKKITEEDKNRTQLYNEEKNRIEAKNNSKSLEEWLISININVDCEKLNSTNFQRTLQLLNKTNQMNLQTKRYSENDLLLYMNDSTFNYYSISVKDDFGNAGLTGVIGLQKVNNTLIVSDFVLSCRVMGRKIEETMLFIVQSIAFEMSLENVSITYIPTEKNKPCHSFFENSGFKISENLYGWNSSNNSPKRPECVQINWNH